MAWANLAPSSYEAFWQTRAGLALGESGLSLDLRGWLNSGLMTLFFFVVGLEARREFDLGELRNRSRMALPLAAGLGGMAAPVAIYLLINAGTVTAKGWGVAMSTDTAIALGLLALVARDAPERIRIFLLTVAVADDLLALVVITVAYSRRISIGPLLAGIALLLTFTTVQALTRRASWSYPVLGLAAWTAFRASGVEPVAVGLALGLLTTAWAPRRAGLERVTDRVRLFREQPTSASASSASASLVDAVSPNERLQYRFHPWTAYVIVPLFALANAGVALDAAFLLTAATSPVALGIMLGYVAGKPLGIIGVSVATDRISRGRLPLPVGWAGLLGTGSIAGIGFTVALLIATLAFDGEALAEAKIGVLTAALLSAALSTAAFKTTSRLTPARRARALLGPAEPLLDQSEPVDPARDHIRGPVAAPVTLVEYGDLECPYCGQAEPVVRDLLSTLGDLRYVWRHLPLTDVHPHAQLAAEATEAAGRQDAFWAMHDLLLTHQDTLDRTDLIHHAEQLGLDAAQSRDDLDQHVGARHVEDDVRSAAASSVAGTPTFFINGRRHFGSYDIDTLTDAVVQARARVMPAHS